MGRPSKLPQKTDERKLQDALLSVANGSSQATMAIMGLNMTKLEKDAERLEEYNAKLEELRGRYAWWKNLFSSEEEQQKILADIERRANAIKKQIADSELRQLPTIRTLVETSGHEEVRDNLELLIIWLDSQLNRSNHLTEEQIASLAEMIIGDFGMLRLEDVAVCFRYGIRGEYGKVYQGLDVQSVLQWLAAYSDELKAHRIEKNERQHISQRGSQWDARISKKLL